MDQDERQQRLEADAIEEGLVRYKRMRDARPLAESKLGIYFLRQTVEPLAAAIRAEQEAISNGEARPKLSKYAIPLLTLDPDKLALITLQSIFNMVVTIGSAGSPPTLAQVARVIGRRCRLERYFDLLRDRARDVYDLLVKRNRNPWNARSRARKLATEVDKDDWSAGHRDLHLGIALINLAVKQAKVFELDNVTKVGRSDVKTPAIIRLTEDARQYLDQRHLYFEALTTPIHLPMIVSPRPWTGLRGGSYLTIQDTELVKYQKNQRTLAALETADLRLVFVAVNALQETPWRINTRLYRIMRRAWEQGYTLAGLPPVHRERLPTRLPENTSSDILKRHKAERARIHRANAKAVGDREVMRMRMHACEKLENEERLYFPYQLDNRGRAYPMPQVFNPQSDDIGRALLEFADGKPLGDRGARWLAVHLANAYGQDKKSFDDRVGWVIEHEAEIHNSAENPLESAGFWMKAEKPWCFLAACMEWVGYCSIGLTFKSHLPIAMDGTCNGLQHLSAMGRDSMGGKATNLMPGDKPEDIYQEVANYVIHRIEADAAAGKEEARTWQGKIDRNLVKRSTMTTPYGVTPAGIRGQLIQDGFTSHLQDKWIGATYLTPILEECISEVVIKGKEIMDWLKQVARSLAEADSGLCWTTPTGFSVVHEYRKGKASRIVTTDYTLLVYEEDPTLRLVVRKQVNAIAPNFVHSLDAAHMMLTVNRLNEAGLRHFAMVHDSYGVHACDVDMLNRVLREEFVRIYRKPVMTRFLAEQRAANPGIALPEPPLLGDLDIDVVLHSEYFFA